MIHPIAYLGFLILELIFSFSIAVYMISMIYSSIKGAPYVPTENKVIDEILDKAKLKKNQLFIELGSGDGRVVRRAVAKYGTRGVGVDINPILILFSRFLAYIKKIKNLSFITKNIFNVEINHADIIFLFMMPEVLKKLVPKFDRELKNKALVISHGFRITGWENHLVEEVKRTPFPTYYYRK